MALWDAEASYAASADRQGNGSLNYTRKFEAVNTSVSVFKSEGQSTAGTVSATGGVVFADGQIVVPGISRTASRCSNRRTGRGGHLPANRRSPNESHEFGRLWRGFQSSIVQKQQHRIADDNVPIGVEVPNNVLAGKTVRKPYKGYVLEVPVRYLRPARIFVNLPALSAQFLRIYWRQFCANGSGWIVLHRKPGGRPRKSGRDSLGGQRTRNVVLFIQGSAGARYEPSRRARSCPSL